MPGKDGTGPSGLGPMTGGGLGFCAGYVNPNITAFYPGVFRRGRSGTRGHRNFYNATGLPGYARYSMGMPAWGNAGYSPYADNPFPQQDIDPKQETEFLKSQSEFLSQQLSDIQERLSQLEKQKEEKPEDKK